MHPPSPVPAPAAPANPLHARAPRSRAAAGSLVWLLLAAALLPAQKPPAGTVVDGDAGAQLDAAVTGAAPAFWGSVLVAIDGRPVLAKGYGFADRARTPLGPGSLFDLGGAAAHLTTLAALRLVAEQKLRLDDLVAQHVADWPKARPFVVRDLLQHRTGLPAAVAWTPSAAASGKQAAQLLGRAPLDAAVAGRFAPANANLLALVVEAAGGQRFEKVLTERVLRPAGMTTALPLGQRGDAKLVAQRRGADGARGEPADRAAADWSQRGASGVLASVLDVHALLTALTTGTLLPAELRAELWQPLAGDAHGVVLAPPPATFVRVHGDAPGFRARWVADAASRSWIVVLTEDQGPLDAVEAALTAATFRLLTQGPAAAPSAPPAPAPGAAPAAPAALPPWPAAASERFAGEFALPRGAGTFRIDAVGGGARLVGVGLQASARVLDGVWPGPAEDRLRTAEDRGLSLLQRVLDDDDTVDRDGFAAAKDGAAARASLRAWVQEHGRPERVDYAGTTLGGRAESWFVLARGERAARVRANWADERTLARCAVAEEPLPFVVALTFVRADVAAATLANGRRLVLTMEGSGAARSLVFEDESPGASGLLDCPLAPR